MLSRVQPVLVLAAVAAVLALTACGGGKRSQPSTTGPPVTATTSPAPTTQPPESEPQPQTEPPPETQPPQGTQSPQDTQPPGLPPSLVGREWERLPTRRKVVALTFDAGANADGAPSILTTLAKAGVPATFFLTGQWVQSFPELAQKIGARYPVGNHTYDHPHLPELPSGAVRREVLRAQKLIGSATGRDPRPLFRFPFGESDARTIAVVNGLGYGGIRWSVDTLGWEGTPGGQSVASVVDRVLAGLAPGEIVLMHVGSNPDDGSTLDADALPEIIAAVRARGYRFVTVDEFF